MKRQAIDGGRWFDLEAAEVFKEDTWFNGNNHISCATGSQWDHEALYRTKSGKWILNHWSQYQGSTESWVEIDDDAAAKWLVTNNEEPHPSCAAEYAALEV
ncbi:MAG: hypothetical protein WC372_07335 [Candidatus Neomarinimicrobiota bacterium]|jgi:hypothetical protein